MSESRLSEIAEGVHLVEGSSTNWVILTEGDGVTLIDSGYPGDRDLLLSSLATLGHSPESVVALLVTHAHTDHIGSAQYLSSTYGTPVLLHEAEVPHAQRHFLEQIGAIGVLRNSWRPGVVPWAFHAMRAGGLADARVTDPSAIAELGVPLDLPGNPIALHTPGHTRGHCVYALPKAGILVSGDALVSGHPTSRVAGPQLLPVMFDASRAAAIASLDVIEDFDGNVLLPGHGPAHHGSVPEAAARARLLVAEA
ncbi:MBL fold metallo-hydrolase [Streptomyces cyaneofuscatus]|uniref:MBL fold metallo-hydrolase n=1 Tax=Streptomyces cyaneofuscatus TaxID=66883 RepID=UPI0033B726EE